MSWTVACFCGNVYSAPPERCAVCGCSIAPLVDDVTQGHANVDGSPTFSPDQEVRETVCLLKTTRLSSCAGWGSDPDPAPSATKSPAGRPTDDRFVPSSQLLSWGSRSLRRRCTRGPDYPRKMKGIVRSRVRAPGPAYSGNERSCRSALRLAVADRHVRPGCDDLRDVVGYRDSALRCPDDGHVAPASLRMPTNEHRRRRPRVGQTTTM
jgi:hypothetical protein